MRKETMDQQVGRYQVLPSQIQAWKKTLVEGASGVFGNSKDQKARNDATLVARPYQEIDDEKWEQMRSMTTVPFDLPEPGVKIAVKVIDQTGMEHMTVIDDPRQTLQK